MKSSETHGVNDEAMSHIRSSVALNDQNRKKQAIHITHVHSPTWICFQSSLKMNHIWAECEQMYAMFRSNRLKRTEPRLDKRLYILPLTDITQSTLMHRIIVMAIIGDCLVVYYVDRGIFGIADAKSVYVCPATIAKHPWSLRAFGISPYNLKSANNEQFDIGDELEGRDFELHYEPDDKDYKVYDGTNRCFIDFYDHDSMEIGYSRFSRQHRKIGDFVLTHLRNYPGFRFKRRNPLVCKITRIIEESDQFELLLLESMRVQSTFVAVGKHEVFDRMGRTVPCGSSSRHSFAIKIVKIDDDDGQEDLVSFVAHSEMDVILFRVISLRLARQIDVVTSSKIDHHLNPCPTSLLAANLYENGPLIRCRIIERNDKMSKVSIIDMNHEADVNECHSSPLWSSMVPISLGSFCDRIEPLARRCFIKRKDAAISKELLRLKLVDDWVTIKVLAMDVNLKGDLEYEVVLENNELM
ncbi:hypothetical protein ACOME3_006012 [Neoechinorhynchus agilis]